MKLDTELDTARRNLIEATAGYEKAINAENIACDEAHDLRDKARTLEAQANAVVIAADNAVNAAEAIYDAALTDAFLTRMRNDTRP